MPQQPRSRFTAGESRSGSADTYTEHIAFELCEILSRYGISQRGLADELGYATGSQVSRMISMQKSLPLEKAELLDAIYGKECPATTIDCTFVDLVKEREAAPRTRQVGKVRRAEYDIFLATPMAAAGKQYSKHRNLVLDVKSALEFHNLSVYTAVDDIASQRDFDSQEIAFATNLDAIQACKAFVLYLPADAAPSATPSSVWVEVGMALARGISCTFFVPSVRSLPYIVQRAYEDPVSKTKLVEVHYFDTTTSRPAELIRRHGKSVLAKG